MFFSRYRFTILIVTDNQKESKRRKPLRKILKRNNQLINTLQTSPFIITTIKLIIFKKNRFNEHRRHINPNDKNIEIANPFRVLFDNDFHQLWNVGNKSSNEKNIAKSDFYSSALKVKAYFLMHG